MCHIDVVCLAEVGGYGTISNDSAITDALEQVLLNVEAKAKLFTKQKENHEKGSNALNEVKQLRETLKNLKKDK